MSYEEALNELRSMLVRVSHDSTEELDRIAADIRDAKEKVRAHYVPIFTPDHLDSLTADDFKSFLLFRNNQHWDSLHRQGGWMTADMPKLREALKILVDESLSIRTRLNRLRPANGESMIKGLGRAVITAILQVLHPDQYGVLNNTAETGMKQLGLWPEIPWGTDFGERYERVNAVLHRVAGDLQIDLWTLDMLWWRVGRPHVLRGSRGEDMGVVAPPSIEPVTVMGEYALGLERYLHEFLVENWSLTELGTEWDLLEEDGEIVGSHFNTREVGEIDLLAKHKNHNRWLVVELKRNQTSDDTVGQMLRYMGWVRHNLADVDAVVEGLIVCHEIDRPLQYALDGQSNVSCMTYRVCFSLDSAPGL